MSIRVLFLLRLILPATGHVRGWYQFPGFSRHKSPLERRSSRRKGGLGRTVEGTTVWGSLAIKLQSKPPVNLTSASNRAVVYRS